MTYYYRLSQLIPIKTLDGIRDDVIGNYIYECWVNNNELKFLKT